MNDQTPQATETASEAPAPETAPTPDLRVQRPDDGSQERLDYLGREFTRRGIAMRKFGELLPKPRTTFARLAGLAHDAGLRMSVNIESPSDGHTPIPTKNQRDRFLFVLEELLGANGLPILRGTLEAFTESELDEAATYAVRLSQHKSNEGPDPGPCPDILR